LQTPGQDQGAASADGLRVAAAGSGSGEGWFERRCGRDAARGGCFLLWLPAASAAFLRGGIFGSGCSGGGGGGGVRPRGLVRHAAARGNDDCTRRRRRRRAIGRGRRGRHLRHRVRARHPISHSNRRVNCRGSSSGGAGGGGCHVSGRPPPAVAAPPPALRSRRRPIGARRSVHHALSLWRSISRAVGGRFGNFVYLEQHATNSLSLAAVSGASSPPSTLSRGALDDAPSTARAHTDEGERSTSGLMGAGKVVVQERGRAKGRLVSIILGGVFWRHNFVSFELLG
jgi:hypothetical protein